MTKKIIRVLVYEGEEEFVRRNLQMRYIKASRSHIQAPGGPSSEYSITETFFDADAVRAWLGEEASPEDMARAQLAVGEVGIVDLSAPAPGLSVREIVQIAAARADAALGTNLAANLLPVPGPWDVDCPMCGSKRGEPCEGCVENQWHAERIAACGLVKLAPTVTSPIEVDCRYCGARAGAPCTTASGAWLTIEHPFHETRCNFARQHGWQS